MHVVQYDDRMIKQRITITADAEVLRAGARAVERGGYASLSEWVNEAMHEKDARDTRLERLAEAVAAYEAEHGVITDAEIAVQTRADREAAIVVRGRRRANAPPRGAAGTEG
jgi:Arc/MetJ-type ribon-helix-helix transcriptional regulator